jgi:hypothetical protein
MSQINLVLHTVGPAGMEYYFVAECDCQPIGHTKSFPESDFPCIWALPCGAQFRINDHMSHYPLMGTCNTSNAAATTLTVTPGQILPAPDNIRFTPWSPEWAEAFTGEKPTPTVCYCFGPPVAECPIHGITSGQGRKAKDWPHIDWK